MDKNAEMLLTSDHPTHSYAAGMTIYQEMLVEFPKIADAIKTFPEPLQEAAFSALTNALTNTLSSQHTWRGHKRGDLPE